MLYRAVYSCARLVRCVVIIFYHSPRSEMKIYHITYRESKGILLMAAAGSRVILNPRWISVWPAPKNRLNEE